MEKQLKIGLKQALELLNRHVTALPVEELPLLEAAGRILAEDLFAKVDSPSVDASLKDGYAVISAEIEHASQQNPVLLKQAATVYAGDDSNNRLTPGTTIRILTGAKIPPGAQGVVAEEFTRREGNDILVMNTAEPGRNILLQGSDIRKGELIAGKARPLSPGLLGLLAAAGHSCLPVVKRPSVAIIATGDEVVAPGKPLPDGKLYASNITTLAAWCRRCDFTVALDIVKDDAKAIENTLARHLKSCDAVITSGGAWTGDHDLVSKVLDKMGGKQIFHRLRIGPGKATGLVLLDGKPVFILPGGPPSNLMGFLQIALPGLFRLAGRKEPPLHPAVVTISEELRTRFSDWTQFIYGRLEQSDHDDIPVFRPIMKKSRLRSMAEADAVIAIGEGTSLLTKGQMVTAQLLR